MNEEVKPRKPRLRAVPHISDDIKAEIEREATAILHARMADARKAAALEIIARKLGEIQFIIGAYGLKSSVSPIHVAATPAPKPAEHPCALCGRDSTWKSKKSVYYCPSHMLSIRMDEVQEKQGMEIISAHPMTNPPLPPIPSNG